VGQRSDLHSELVAMLGSTNVYFQPPSNVQMKFPAIVYERDDRWVVHAGNGPYVGKQRYFVTVIDRNPDSVVLEKFNQRPLCRFSRHFVVEGLNHDAYTLYH